MFLPSDRTGYLPWNSEKWSPWAFQKVGLEHVLKSAESLQRLGCDEEIRITVPIPNFFLPDDRIEYLYWPWNWEKWSSCTYQKRIYKCQRAKIVCNFFDLHQKEF